MILSAILIFAGALNTQTVQVSGSPTDALVLAADVPEIWITSARGSRRKIMSTTGNKKPITVGRSTVFVDTLGTGVDARFVVWKRSGVYALDGSALLKASGVFGVADPQRLFAVGANGPGNEIRFLAHDGIHVLPPDGEEYTLAPFRGELSRAYSGKIQQGINAQKRYSVALSVYGPQLFDTDVDGDGDIDLLVILDRQIGTYLRQEGRLAKTPTMGTPLISELPDDDLRVLVGDVDGDKRSDIVVSAHRGKLPNHSTGWLIKANAANEFVNKTQIWRNDGLVEPIAIHESAGLVTTMNIDTGTVALGKVLMGGSANLVLKNVDTSGKTSSEGPTVKLDIDIRRGRMAGQLPVGDVDLNRDGHLDLVTFSDRNVEVYLGNEKGIPSAKADSTTTKSFDRVLSLPKASAVVLFHKKSVTILTWKS